MSRISFVADDADAGVRLDVVVARRAGVSRSVAAGLTVLVEGEPSAKSLRLESGNRVEIHMPEAPEPPVAEHVELTIAYEDEHLLVVDKPAGLVVHPAPGHEHGTLVNALMARAQQPVGGEAFRPGIVHRLDAGTSGLMVVAKSDAAFERLAEMMSQRLVNRTYVALVKGSPRSAAATIDAPIGRSERHRKKMAVVASGKEAITHYVVVESLGDVSLLEIVLGTGRTHQIRVHLAEIGHPVIADPAYGRSAPLARRLELQRPFLHACKLSFAHPITDEEIALESPLPPDLEAALAIARAEAPRQL